MAKISNSELRAAVSAIMERDQSETPLRQMSKRADLSALSRTHREGLQSEFAKAGVDFGRLEKLHSDYKKERSQTHRKANALCRFKACEASQKRSEVDAE